jgi:hypothetical protein
VDRRIRIALAAGLVLLSFVAFLMENSSSNGTVQELAKWLGIGLGASAVMLWRFGSWKNT